MKNNQTELTAEEVLENVSLKHSIKTGKHLYHHWLVTDRDSLKLALSAMHEHKGLRTAELQAEKAELVEALNSYRKQLADELAACEAKLNELSPLGRHALQAPIKAQIALLKDLLAKHTK